MVECVMALSSVSKTYAPTWALYAEPGFRLHSAHPIGKSNILTSTRTLTRGAVGTTSSLPSPLTLSTVPTKAVG